MNYESLHLFFFFNSLPHLIKRLSSKVCSFSSHSRLMYCAVCGDGGRRLQDYRWMGFIGKHQKNSRGTKSRVSSLLTLGHGGVKRRHVLHYTTSPDCLRVKVTKQCYHTPCFVNPNRAFTPSSKSVFILRPAAFNSNNPPAARLTA